LLPAEWVAVEEYITTDPCLLVWSRALHDRFVGEKKTPLPPGIADSLEFTYLCKVLHRCGYLCADGAFDKLQKTRHKHVKVPA